MTTYTWQDVGDENNKILTQEEKQTIADKWNANEQAKEALDNSVFGDAQKDGRYVKYDPQRDTKVTFGKS